jgi:CheY-like chemotaxis protein
MTYPSVIIVDDDIDTVEVLSEYLSLKDIYSLGRGHDGKQAVELFKEHKPDVCLIDLHMPHFDGFYAIREIKKLDLDAKIIVVTGDTENLSDDEEKKLSRLGVSGYIIKPYEIDSVVETIQRVAKE